MTIRFTPLTSEWLCFHWFGPAEARAWHAIGELRQFAWAIQIGWVSVWGHP